MPNGSYNNHSGSGRQHSSRPLQKPAGMSDFDWDTHRYGKAESRQVINGITMAYFPGQYGPRFYGGDADRAQKMYGNHLMSSDPRVSAIQRSRDLFRNVPHGSPVRRSTHIEPAHVLHPRVPQPSHPQKPAGMSDFDWDTRQFGKPVSRQVINGITVAYFPGHQYPRFYGGDADIARHMYGNRLRGPDPRVQQIIQTHNLPGSVKSESAPRSGPVGPSHPTHSKSWGREAFDNTFGTGKTHGDLYNMGQGLIKLPDVASDAVANIMNGAWNSGAGLYDEATGNYADEQQRAAAAQASADKSRNMIAGMFGANPGGMLYRIVDAAGLASGGDTSDAGVEMKGVGHDAVVHPVQTAAALLPFAKPLLLAKVAVLEKMAAMAPEAERADLLAKANQIQKAASGGVAADKVRSLMSQADSLISEHPVAGPIKRAIETGTARATKAVDDVNHFRNPMKPKVPPVEPPGGVAIAPKSSEAPGKPGASFDSGKPTTVTGSNPAANLGLLSAHPKTGLKLNGVSWTPSGVAVHKGIGELTGMSGYKPSDLVGGDSDTFGAGGLSTGASADAGAFSSSVGASGDDATFAIGGVPVRPSHSYRTGSGAGDGFDLTYRGVKIPDETITSGSAAKATAPSISEGASAGSFTNETPIATGGSSAPGMNAGTPNAPRFRVQAAQPGTIAEEAQQDQIGAKGYGYVPDYWEPRLTNGRKYVVQFSGPTGKIGGGYFTSPDLLVQNGFSARDLLEKVQVGPHPVFNYWTHAHMYEVPEGTPYAEGTTISNPHFGEGGADQYWFRPEDRALMTHLGTIGLEGPFTGRAGISPSGRFYDDRSYEISPPSTVSSVAPNSSADSQGE